MEIMTANSIELAKPSKTEAIGLAKMLMGMFRSVEYPDPKVFSVGLCQVFSAYPFEHGKAVVDPLRGLPSKLKFTPAISEVKAELDRLDGERQRLAWTAKRELEERENQRQHREWEARLDAERNAREIKRQTAEADDRKEKGLVF
ncbi:hypothetical protein LMIY3S_03673 [Labrys miyagiensis]